MSLVVENVNAGQPDNTSGLILYYQFNNDTARGENNSLILDHSVRLNTERDNEVHNNGTADKAIYNNTKKLLGTNDICFAGDANDEILIPDFKPFTDDFTFCWWIKPIVGTGDRVFLTTGTDWDSDHDITSYVTSTDVIVFDGRAGAAKPLNLIGTTNIGTDWQFVCGRRNATHGTLFINGTEDVTDATASGTIGNNADLFYLGIGFAWSVEIDACVSEVQIWNRSLEKREIVSLYNGGLGNEIKDVTPPIINISSNITLQILQNNVINISANVTDKIGLDTCQIIINQTGVNEIFNFSLSGTRSECSQNFTMKNVEDNINFTVRVNDTSNNLNQSSIFLTVGDTTNPILNNCTLSSTSITDASGNTINLTCDATDASSNIQTMVASLNGTINKTLIFSFIQEQTIKTTYVIFQSLETLLVGAYSINQVNVTDTSLNKLSNTTKDLHFEVTLAPSGGGGTTGGGGGGGGTQTPIIIKTNETIITGQCNFNKKCEPQFGEDSFNCNVNAGGDCEFKFEEIFPTCLVDKNQQCVWRTAIVGRILLIAVIISFLILISDTQQGRKVRKVLKEQLNINILKE